MANRPASAPPPMAKVGVSPSASLADVTVTSRVFSATETLALAPPPSLTMTGASLTLATGAVAEEVRVSGVPWPST